MKLRCVKHSADRFIKTYESGAITEISLLIALIQMAVEVEPSVIAPLLTKDLFNKIKADATDSAWFDKERLIVGIEVDSEKETIKYNSGLKIWREYFKNDDLHITS